MSLLDEILEMKERDLVEFIEKECDEREIEFDRDMLDDTGIIGLYDFIAENLYPQYQSVLHSECQLELGNSMFPNAETEEELEEAMQRMADR